MSDIAGLDTRIAYLLLIALVIAERLIELVVSRRNERRARARGGVEAGAGHYLSMVLLHTAFLASCPLEVWALDRPFVPALGFSMLAVLVGTMALRYWTIHTLGDRWTTRVLVVPGLPAVNDGPFRHVRHPNYLAVILEIAALPLVHGAWATALVFSAANGWLLRVRIRTEEKALSEHGAYLERLGDTPRLVPR